MQLLCGSGLGGFASSFFGGSSGNNRKHSHHSSDPSDLGFGNLLMVAGFLFLAYYIYTNFLKNDGSRGSPTAPPPPGFKPEFTGFQYINILITVTPSCIALFGQTSLVYFFLNISTNPDYSGVNPGYGFRDDFTRRRRYPGEQASNFGGFWTGMGTGATLGYLFGRQRKAE